MHKFLIRAISGIIYAAVIILAIVYGGWSIYALAMLFASIAYCELNHMAMGYSRRLLPIYVTSVLGVDLAISVIKFSIMIPYAWVIALSAVFLLMCCAYYISVSRIKGVTAKEFIAGDYAKTPMFGFGYLGIPLAMMTIFPVQRLALLVFALLWINDSGAYIVGSLTGRHKLCPSVSPNKTWEGFIGGCVLTIIGTVLLDVYCDSFFGMADFPLWIWIAIGVLTCIFGTLGDLLESKIKRFYGAKDSGHWIPGHGGILDRIDSFLLAYPVVAIILCLLDM
ncbi:MAG: phosphatidate cytidylyltransferase [Muribaculaceae bacterium]|nr:phosphatidate cytidylyltransferase [Muribaculaceae bacterium]